MEIRYFVVEFVMPIDVYKEREIGESCIVGLLSYLILYLQHGKLT